MGLEEGDLFVLQPTRVVPRKGIERAVDLVARMELPNPTLVISHSSGDEGDLYARQLGEYARRAGVRLVHLGERVGPSRRFGVESDLPYTIDDVYAAADLVTYPSTYEGFGNAFVEAVYFRKPVVVNRYSIFIEDIEPRGFRVVAFDGFITREVVDEVRRFLEPSRRDEAVERNFELGREHFSFRVLRQRLLPLVEVVG